MKNFKYIILLLITTLVSCDFINDLFEDDNFPGGAGGVKVSTPTKLVGENLNQSRGYDLKPYTPINVEGMALQVGIMVGNTNGSAIHLISSSVEGFMKASVNSTDKELKHFNLAEPVLTQNEYVLGDKGRYPADTNAIITRVEILFAWVDFTFKIDSGTLAGNHKIRVVYADITDLGYKKGDVLYFDTTDSLYKWGHSGDRSIVETRPSKDILQISEIANYSGTPDGKGNQFIESFTANIPESKQVPLTYDTVLLGKTTYEVVFDMTDGLQLLMDSAVDFKSVYELLEAFRVSANVGSSSGFKAHVILGSN